MKAKQSAPQLRCSVDLASSNRSLGLRLGLGLTLSFAACDKATVAGQAPAQAPNKERAEALASDGSQAEAPDQTASAVTHSVVGRSAPVAGPRLMPRDPSQLDPARRVVAIGDVHGDYQATLRVLRLAGAIDDTGEWSGGDLVLVQTGDQLDRGEGEQQIVDLFERLRPQARAAGGWVLALNGNHEIMNASGDLRYVTPGGLEDFEDAIDPVLTKDPRLVDVPAPARARLAAFLPGGPYAKILATRNVAVRVGETVFVHGGVRPDYAREGLEAFNASTAKWLQGGASGGQIPAAMTDSEGPIWTRKYSDQVDEAACADLRVALDALGAKRMVVGHTVQATGINPACDKAVWRIDVGLASHYGSAQAQVLEIRGDDVRVLAGEPAR